VPTEPSGGRFGATAEERSRFALALERGDLFDNLQDTLTVERLQVFDFEAMRA
jgi:hypothetical protein